MRKLLLLLLLTPLMVIGQPYTYNQLTNLVVTELPSNTNGMIRATNLWNVFNGVLLSTPLPPTYIFSGIGQLDPATGFRLDVVPDATGGESELVWDTTTHQLKKTAKSGHTSGTAILSGGVYTISSPSPPYTSTSTYPDTMVVYFRAGSQSGGSDNLKIGSGPSKQIKLADLSTIAVADIVSNAVVCLAFSSAADAWILQESASRLAFDDTLYTSVDGPLITVGVRTNRLVDSSLYQVASGTNVTIGIKTNGVTVTDIEQTPSNVLLGRYNVGTGNYENLTIGANLSVVGGALTSASPGGAGAFGSSTIQTANYTVATNVTAVFVDASSQNVVITLPGAILGQQITITRADSTAHFVHVAAASTNNIVGAPNPFPLYFQGDTITVRGDSVSVNHYYMGGTSWVMGNRPARRFTALAGDEFYSSANNTGPLTWSPTVNGASASVGIADYSLNGAYQGVFSFVTGSTTNGNACLTQRGTLILPDANPAIAQIFFQIPTLSTDTDEFVAEVGFGDGTAQNDLADTDCVLVRYRHRENSGKFQIRVCAGGVGNSVFADAGVTAVAATWYRATILASSTLVSVDINGTLSSIATGIPSGSTQLYTYCLKISKIGGSSGVNTRNMLVDRYDASKFANR